MAEDYLRRFYLTLIVDDSRSGCYIGVDRQQDTLYTGRSKNTSSGICLPKSAMKLLAGLVSLTVLPFPRRFFPCKLTFVCYEVQYTLSGVWRQAHADLSERCHQYSCEATGANDGARSFSSYQASVDRP